MKNEPNLLKEALSGISQGLLVIDDQLRIVYANERLTEIFGVPPQFIAPGELVEHFHRYLAERGEYGPGDPETHVAFRQNVVRSGMNYALDRRQPNGRYLAVTGNILPSGGYVVTFTDITERIQEQDRLETLVEERTRELSLSNQELQRLATLDPMLGIANRKRLMEQGAIECRRAARDRTPLAALMIDVDHFKDINDRYGHAVGDEVLHEISRRILEAIRATDLLSRFGGEEFSVLLPNTPLAGARIIAERIRELVSARPVETHAGLARVSVSIGVSERLDDEADIAAALDRADGGLYKAKQEGRNRIAVAAPCG